MRDTFPHCPGAVAEVVAVEPERRPRRLAATAGLRAGVPVDVVPGAAEALRLTSEAFDAAGRVAGAVHGAGPASGAGGTAAGAAARR